MNSNFCFSSRYLKSLSSIVAKLLSSGLLLIILMMRPTRDWTMRGSFAQEMHFLP